MAATQLSQERPAVSSLNAESQPQSTASGTNTHGILNQHPSPLLGSDGNPVMSKETSKGKIETVPFRIGVSEDCNKRWRRTMEDSHAFVYDFGGVYGQGFFGIFDGHAGKHAAEWCGRNFHLYLLDSLRSSPKQAVPDLLNATFHNVDRQLSRSAKEQRNTSGCTAVTAFLRLEDENGRPLVAPETGGIVSSDEKDPSGKAQNEDAGRGKESGGIFSEISKRIRRSSADTGEFDNHDGLVKVSSAKARRVLYTANVGDARAVLCRGGKAIRLTYDHKGSDAQEAKRITDAGGFVMNNRVNGVLAVTRSLGDSAMKEFVVGSPYTTETTLGDDDTFLIVACDGLWDVTDDQDAVDLILNEKDPQKASETLLQHALNNFSTDNTSVMVIRFGVASS